MGISLKSVGRFIAKPFEKAGQGVKHFFTGPEYDQMAGAVKQESDATGQTQFGQTAPLGPLYGQIPQVGSHTTMGYQSAPKSGVGQSGGNSGWIGKVADHLLPKKPDGSVDWVKAAELGLAVWAGVEGYQQGKKADALSEEAIAIERERMAALKPLRDMAVGRLAGPRSRPDHSELTDQTNPYRQQKDRLPVVGRGRRGGY